MIEISLRERNAVWEKFQINVKRNDERREKSKATRLSLFICYNVSKNQYRLFHVLFRLGMTNARSLEYLNGCDAWWCLEREQYLWARGDHTVCFRLLYRKILTIICSGRLDAYLSEKIVKRDAAGVLCSEALVEVRTSTELYNFGSPEN